MTCTTLRAPVILQPHFVTHTTKKTLGWCKSTNTFRIRHCNQISQRSGGHSKEHFEAQNIRLKPVILCTKEFRTNTSEEVKPKGQIVLKARFPALVLCLPSVCRVLKLTSQFNGFNVNLGMRQ